MENSLFDVNEKVVFQLQSSGCSDPTGAAIPEYYLVLTEFEKTSLDSITGLYEVGGTVPFGKFSRDLDLLPIPRISDRGIDLLRAVFFPVLVDNIQSPVKIVTP